MWGRNGICKYWGSRLKIARQNWICCPSRTNFPCRWFCKCNRVWHDCSTLVLQTISHNSLGLLQIVLNRPSIHLPMAFLPSSLLWSWQGICNPSSHGLARCHQKGIACSISKLQRMYQLCPKLQVGFWYSTFQIHPKCICAHVETPDQQPQSSRRTKKKIVHTYTRSCQPPAQGTHPHVGQVELWWPCSLACSAMDVPENRGALQNCPKKLSVCWDQAK